MAFKEVIICEKGTQAKVFRQLLKLDKVKSFGKFNVAFYSERSNIVVVHQSGHLIEQCGPELYQPLLARNKRGWDPELLPVIPKPDEWKLKVKEDAYNTPTQYKGRTQALFDSIKWALVDNGTPGEISLAVDNDKEGELLGWEILDHFNLLNHPKISRLIYSANTIEGIGKAYQEKQPGSLWFNRFQAGLARQRGDWVFGMNMTIALTGVNRKFLPPNDPLHTGRVILAIGYIICLRQEEIDNFVPKNFFKQKAWFKNDKGEMYAGMLRYPENWLDPETRYMLNEKNAQAIHAALQQKPAGIISLYEKSDKKKGPPIGFHRTGFERYMIKKHAAGLEPVGSALQKLYSEKALITYPRVEVKQLDISLHGAMPGYLDAILSNLLSCPQLTEEEKQEYRRAYEIVDSNRKSGIWAKGVDEKESHHAIIPTNLKSSLNDLTPLEFLVYRELCDRLIIQFMPDYEYASTKIVTTVNIRGHDFNFESSGSTPLVLGWKSLHANTDAGGADDDEKSDGDDSDDESKNDTLPLMSQGESVRTEKSELQQKVTVCPKLYSEAELLQDLENPKKFVKNKDLLKRIKKLQIGTGGTRREHIKNLKDKRYVTLVEEGRGKKKIVYFKPTAKLFALNSIAPDYFKLPETSAYWEESFNAIQDGEINIQQFMDRQLKIMARFMSELQQGKFNLSSPASDKYASCPLNSCSGFAFPATSKKGFSYWSCSTCSNAFTDDSGKPGQQMGLKTSQDKPDRPRDPDEKFHTCTACKKGKAYFKELPNKTFNLWECEKCKASFFDDKGALGKQLRK